MDWDDPTVRELAGGSLRQRVNEIEEINDLLEQALGEAGDTREPGTLRLREAREALERRRYVMEVERQFRTDRARARALLREEERQRRRRDLERRLRDLERTARVRNPQLEARFASDVSDMRLLEDSHCVSCLDNLSDHHAHRSPCGHRWCRACIVNRFEMAARSTQMFPAQCCGQPILPDYHGLVAPETWNQYFEKRAEVQTRNPIYCSKRDCSKFIPRRNITEGRARCVCGQVTCTSCKSEWHSGECVTDPETEQVLRLARRERWQTCFHCRQMVIRRRGCNEMECRCGRTFCYACGLEWKTCHCPQFGRAAPAVQPLIEPAVQPLIEPAVPPLIEPAVQPLIEPAVPPLIEPVQPLIEPAVQPFIEPAVQRFFEPAVQPLFEPFWVDTPDGPIELTRELDRWDPRYTSPRQAVEPVEVDDTGRIQGTEMFHPMMISAMQQRPAEGEGRSGRASQNNPGCRAHNWIIDVGGTCQTCNTVMPHFLFHCSTCGHNFCRQCRQRADRAR